MKERKRQRSRWRKGQMEKRNDLLKTTVKEVTAGIGLFGILELLICVLFVGGGPGTLTVLKVRSMGGVILGCLFAAGWFLQRDMRFASLRQPCFFCWWHGQTGCLFWRFWQGFWRWNRRFICSRCFTDFLGNLAMAKLIGRNKFESENPDGRRERTFSLSGRFRSWKT